MDPPNLLSSWSSGVSFSFISSMLGKSRKRAWSCSAILFSVAAVMTGAGCVCDSSGLDPDLAKELIGKAGGAAWNWAHLSR